MNRPCMAPRLGLVYLGLVHLGLIGLAQAEAGVPEPGGQEPNGVVIEHVADGFAAHRAGLRPGDLLLHWQRDAASPETSERGRIDSPFDLLRIEVESPRGELTLIATRGGRRRVARLGAGAWELQSRPALSPGSLDSYRQAQALLAAGEIEEALAVLTRLAGDLGHQGDHIGASWLLLRAAGVASESGLPEVSDRAFEQAKRQARAGGGVGPVAEIAQAHGSALEARDELQRAAAAIGEALDLHRSRASSSLAVARTLNSLGIIAKKRRDMVLASGYFHRALAIQEKLAPHSLDVSRSLHNLGITAVWSGDLEAGEDNYRRSLAIGEALAPRSLETAKTLANLGIVAWKKGDLGSAESFFRRSLAIQEAAAPRSLDTARTLGDLGALAIDRGDLAAAEGLFGNALAIQQEITPSSLEVADSLDNLGNVAINRGDLAAAERFHRRSLAIKEQLAPHSFDVARSLNNLGNVAFSLGDLVTAEDFHRRALGFKEKLAAQSLAAARRFSRQESAARRQGDPEAADGFHRHGLALEEELEVLSLSLSASLNNLGNVAWNRGDLGAAEDFHRRSLVLQQKLTSESLGIGKSFNNLGGLAHDRGDFATAEDYLLRALEIQQKLAPRSIDSAESLHRLGDVAVARGELETAEARYRRSLAIRRERAPGTAVEAESCQRLAALHRRRGQLDQSLDFYACAVGALEAQKSKLGGSDEVRSRFGVRHADTYREAIALLVERGETRDAWLLAERFRARELLNLLGQRDLVFSSDIPEDLARRRRDANQSYDRALGRFMNLSDHDETEQLRQTRQVLEQARRRQDEIRAEIRATSPRLAALEQPQPLDLSATRAALDDGTLLLSYSIGENSSHLFAVGPRPGAFRVYALPIGRQAVAGDVGELRRALSFGRYDRRREKALLHARRLSEQLLLPAAEQISEADRLLILADGPLHSMPFAALTDPGAIDGRRFLVETVAVHLAASATVFALLKGQRRGDRPVRLTAFGDPSYPSAGPAGEHPTGSQQALTRRGFELAPLPATRAEVEALQALFPEQAQVYLGAEATEERAKSVGPTTTHLHIASHGLLDDRFPLDSALAFSIPEAWRQGQDNGLLQAWEVFEQARLDAELVTLSACDTGLGQVFGGEGLMGLTRAFQYAGARSVVASLWSVSDRSTGELMRRFYGHLKQGESKVEALRAAQLELLADPELSHPFHWAGFVLVGDWR